MLPSQPATLPTACERRRRRGPRSERLSKRVAAQLSCSRRGQEQLIAQGAVTVDRLAATLPQQRVGTEQRVAVAGAARVRRRLPPATLVVRKPARLACDAAGFWARIAARRRRSLHSRPALPGLFMGQRCVAPRRTKAAWSSSPRCPAARQAVPDDAPLVEHEFSIDVPGAVDCLQLQRRRPARASINRQSPERTGLRVVMHGQPGQVGARRRRPRRIAQAPARSGAALWQGSRPGTGAYLQVQERF